MNSILLLTKPKPRLRRVRLVRSVYISQSPGVLRPVIRLQPVTWIHTQEVEIARCICE
jgi:hypothetical protein